MAKKPDYKAAYERRNARAKAEGYKSYNDKRIKEGQERGLSKSQAAGKPKKGEESASKLKEKQEAGFIHIEGIQHEKRHDRIRVLDIEADGQQMKVYKRLERKKKHRAAIVYALSEVYGVPEMAGIEWNDSFEFSDDWINEVDEGDSSFLDVA